MVLVNIKPITLNKFRLGPQQLQFMLSNTLYTGTSYVAIT